MGMKKVSMQGEVKHAKKLNQLLHESKTKVNPKSNCPRTHFVHAFLWLRTECSLFQRVATAMSLPAVDQLSEFGAQLFQPKFQFVA